MSTPEQPSDTLTDDVVRDDVERTYTEAAQLHVRDRDVFYRFVGAIGGEDWLTGPTRQAHVARSHARALIASLEATPDGGRCDAVHGESSCVLSPRHYGRHHRADGQAWGAAGADPLVLGSAASAPAAPGTGQATPVNPCVFCDITVGDGEAEFLRRDEHTVIFTPLNPVTPGHALVVPIEHVVSAEVRPWITGIAFHDAAVYAAEQGVPFNLITSAGAPATQTVHHLHVHYVPRHEDDGLHLPWTGQAATS